MADQIDLAKEALDNAERQVNLNARIIDNHLTRIERSEGILANRALVQLGQALAANPTS